MLPTLTRDLHPATEYEPAWSIMAALGLVKVQREPVMPKPLGRPPKLTTAEDRVYVALKQEGTILDICQRTGMALGTARQMVLRLRHRHLVKATSRLGTSLSGRGRTIYARITHD